MMQINAKCIYSKLWQYNLPTFGGPFLLMAELVMPSVQAALQRLQADDPIWDKDAQLVFAAATNAPVTPWREIRMWLEEPLVTV